MDQVGDLSSPQVSSDARQRLPARLTMYAISCATLHGFYRIDRCQRIVLIVDIRNHM